MKMMTLNNGMEIPAIGFGTYKAAADGTEAAIRTAIATGYRYFDTASFYHTEEAVGKAWTESGVERGEIILQTKAWKTELGYKAVQEAFAASLQRLRTDYIDIYLIHWPLPNPDCADWETLDADTWKAMEELVAAGRVRAIGVSNFLPHHLMALAERTTVKPVLDQIEFHPGHTQEATLRYCLENNICVQAWSPLGRTRVMSDPLIVELAAKYGVSPAAFCLAYDLQRGVSVIPKASSLDRMRENLHPGDFTISDYDMARVDTMPDYGWSGEHPDRPRGDPAFGSHIAR